MEKQLIQEIKTVDEDLMRAKGQLAVYMENKTEIEKLHETLAEKRREWAAFCMDHKEEINKLHVYHQEKQRSWEVYMQKSSNPLVDLHDTWKNYETIFSDIPNEDLPETFRQLLHCIFALDRKIIPFLEKS